MTAALRSPTRRVYYATGAHRYFLDGEKVPGITTMMRGLSGPPERYYAETAAGYVIDNWDALAGMTPAQRFRAVAGASREVRDTLAVRGTRVHEAAQVLLAGGEVMIADEERPYVQACAQFLDDHDVQMHSSEVAVFSRANRHAGSADFFAWARKPSAETVFVLGDWKTGRKRPWGSAAFQLAGYRYSEFFLDGDGAEHDMPVFDECWAVWLRGNGDYEVIPMHATEEVYEQLLYINQARLADGDTLYYRGDPLPKPSGVRRVTLTTAGDGAL